MASHKRHRLTGSSSHRPSSSPGGNVLYGTPISQLDSSKKDKNAFVPVWKQEAFTTSLDGRPRKRFHGAFTGGFSAGHFNTVGSREGWVPSQFVSSRSKNVKSTPVFRQKPEDFMDEGDLEDEAAHNKLEVIDHFSSLGSTTNDCDSQSPLRSLVMLSENRDGMGTRLLINEGWRPGQGIGPLIRRPIYSESEDEDAGKSDSESSHNQAGPKTHLFAPKDVPLVKYQIKTDSKGLGFNFDLKISPLDHRRPRKSRSRLDSDSNSEVFGTQRELRGPQAKLFSGRRSTGIGIEIHGSSDEDDEDTYATGPRISYVKSISSGASSIVGASHIKDRKIINGLSHSKSPFDSKKVSIKPSNLNLIGSGSKKSNFFQSPQPTLPGFVCYGSPCLETSSKNAFAPIIVPEGWTPLKRLGTVQNPQGHEESTPLLNPDSWPKFVHMNPTKRGEMLGEKSNQSRARQSIFGLISAEARDRIAKISGRTDLPPAKDQLKISSHEAELESEVPQTVKIRAAEQNQASAGIAAAMAARFVSAAIQSSSEERSDSQGSTTRASFTYRPANLSDSSQLPSQANIFGPGLTRTVSIFRPTPFLCRRLGVEMPDERSSLSLVTTNDPSSEMDRGASGKTPSGASSGWMERMMSANSTFGDVGSFNELAGKTRASQEDEHPTGGDWMIEAPKPSMEIFNAVFGDDDED